jgi:hypothetical protein
MTAAAVVTALVSMTTSSFAPAQLDVLAGDNVVWRNNSLRTHNVKFESAGFDLGRIAPRGGASHVFPSPGAYPYVCTIHDGMDGEVRVHPLLLQGPTGPVRRGTEVALGIRAPEDPGEVRIEADTGAGFRPVAVATPLAGEGHEAHTDPGMLHATVVAAESASYRAVSAAGASPVLRVEVTDGALVSAATRRARRGGTLVKVRTTPASPGARVVLQVRLRERFGWWPVDRARLDRRSRAVLSVRGHRGAKARVVMVGADWATPAGQSAVFRLRR